jgi:Na+/H+-dicarboxylate symporter
LGVRPELASFTVPLCATIHLSGSTMKIVACAMAIMILTGNGVSVLDMAAFIAMLGVTMVAAPGVPGGAIMAAIGVLQSMLGFDEMQIGLMIALYIAMDSFGTATNVTGDGAVTVIVDKMYKGE